MATSKPTAQYENITPKKAEHYLNKNTCNRALREGVVERYAADMKAGKWTECAAPIVFYDDGSIADGQHRLYAIIESGTSQNFFVRHGFPKTASLNIDTGAHRTFIDNVRIGRGEVYSKFLVATARWIKHGTREFQRSPTYAEDLQTVIRYKEEASFAESCLGKGKGIKRVPVAAAVARAKLSGETETALKRFGEVFTKGFADGVHESAAVALRNYCIQLMDRNAAGRTVDRELFLKAQNAVYYFCRGRKLTVIKSVANEMYPLKKSK